MANVLHTSGVQVPMFWYRPRLYNSTQLESYGPYPVVAMSFPKRNPSSPKEPTGLDELGASGSQGSPKQGAPPAPPNYPLRHPRYHLIEIIRPLIEVPWGLISTL